MGVSVGGASLYYFSAISAILPSGLPSRRYESLPVSLGIGGSRSLDFTERQMQFFLAAKSLTNSLILFLFFPYSDFSEKFLLHLIKLLMFLLS